MKDIETKHRFVELRAQGKSLRTVASELAVGLQTVVRWERKYKEQIESLNAMELDALMERHRLTVQARIERFGSQLKRVTDELEKRDLSDVATPKLVYMALKLDAALSEGDNVLELKALRAELKQLKAKATSKPNEAQQESSVLPPECVAFRQVTMQVLGHGAQWVKDHRVMLLYQWEDVRTLV